MAELSSVDIDKARYDAATKANKDQHLIHVDPKSGVARIVIPGMSESRAGELAETLKKGQLSEYGVKPEVIRNDKGEYTVQFTPKANPALDISVATSKQMMIGLLVRNGPANEAIREAADHVRDDLLAQSLEPNKAITQAPNKLGELLKANGLTGCLAACTHTPTSPADSKPLQSGVDNQGRLEVQKGKDQQAGVPPR